VRPAQKREAACRLQDQFAVSERRACRVLRQPRSSQRRKAKEGAGTFLRPPVDESRRYVTGGRIR
jgi:hypothetical protein